MASDKDRLGDTLKKKEKAEEDLYFARQDKAKLDAMKESSQPEAQLGLCPRCGIALNEQDHQGVKIDLCPKCNGVWLDPGELEEVIGRESEGWASRWVRSLLKG